MSRNTRSTAWFWFILVVGILVGAQVLYAVGTHDTACGSADAPKHWVVFPPHWECDRGF